LIITNRDDDNVISVIVSNKIILYFLTQKMTNQSVNQKEVISIKKLNLLSVL